MRPITDAEVLEAIERLGWGEFMAPSEAGERDVAVSDAGQSSATFPDGKKLVGQDLGAKPPASAATEAGFTIRADMLLKEVPGGK